MAGRVHGIFLRQGCLVIYAIYCLVFWTGIAIAKPDCDAEDIVIRVQTDYEKLVKGCKELSGNLAVAVEYDRVSVLGVERIRGNLFVKDGLADLKNWTKIGNPAERSIDFPSLTMIDGNLEVSKFGSNAPYGVIKPTLAMGPVDVGGAVYIHDSVMSLVNVRLGKTQKTTFGDNIDINTRLAMPLDVSELELYGNTLSVSEGQEPFYYFPDVTEVRQKIYMLGSSLTLGSQASATTVTYSGLRMPKLEWSPEIYVREAPILELPSLQFINKSLELKDIKVGRLEFPELINIGTDRSGSLTIEGATKLFKFDVASLRTIQGNVVMTGNTLLKDIGGFGSLRSVSGDMLFDGPIWSLSLPSIDSIEGSLTIKSSAPFNCTPWNEKQIATRFVKGNYTCESEIDPQYLEAGFDRNSVGQDGPRSDTPQNAQNRVPMIAGAVAGAVVAILAIGIGIFYFRRRPRKIPDLLPGIANPELETKEAPLYEIDAKKTQLKAEAVGYIPPTELTGDFAPVEMFVSNTIPAELQGSDPEPLQPPSPDFARNSRLNRSQQRRRSDTSLLDSSEGGRDSWVPRDEAAFTSNRAGYLRDCQFQNGSAID
ncbi:hypothetical protein TWF730_000057 [Orbilia blumenaviensis]|uniref:Uncharacterized protein n=1 Tax=Orbilia blumenaviensis TaxID=1796055 RepID=A0AAV9VKE0_9PEZI